MYGVLTEKVAHSTNSKPPTTPWGWGVLSWYYEPLFELVLRATHSHTYTSKCTCIHTYNMHIYTHMYMAVAVLVKELRG